MLAILGRFEQAAHVFPGVCLRAFVSLIVNDEIPVNIKDSFILFKFAACEF